MVERQLLRMNSSANLRETLMLSGWWIDVMFSQLDVS